MVNQNEILVSRVKIPRRLWARLKMEATLTNKHVQDLVTEAIAEYVSKRRRSEDTIDLKQEGVDLKKPVQIRIISDLEALETMKKLLQPLLGNLAISQPTRNRRDSGYRVYINATVEV